MARTVIRLYRAHWSTNCERVALALARKGVEVESVLISYSDRSAVERISRQGLVPVIVDGDQVVHDSTRIMRHLEQRFPEPPLWPGDLARGAELDLFLEWFNEEWKRAPNAIEEELEGADPDDAMIERWSARMAASLDHFERLLTGRDYLFGDQLSAADCAAFPFLKYAALRDPKDTELFHVMLDDQLRLGDDHRRLAAWIDRIDALPRAYGPTVEQAALDGP